MNNQSESKNTGMVVKGASITFVGMVYQLVLSFVSGIIITRTIGSENYGIFSLARTLGETLSVFTKLGFDIGLVRYFGEKSSQNHDKINAHFLKLVLITVSILSILPVLLIWGGGGTAIENYIYQYEHFADVLAVMVLLVPLISIVQVISGAFRGVFQIKPRVYGELFMQPTIRLIIILMLFYVGWNIWAAIVGTVLSYVVVLVYMLILMNKHFFRCITGDMKEVGFQKATMKELVSVGKYSVVISLTVAVAMLLAKTDVIMLGFFVTADKIGQYVVIQLVVGLIIFVNAALNQMVAPMLAKLHRENKKPEMKKLINQHTRWVMIASLPIFIIIAQYGIHIIAIFGEDFVVQTLVLPILALSQLTVAVLSSAGFILSMTGKHKLEFYTMAFALICNVILNLMLIPEMGIEGAALSTLISIILANLLRIHQVYRIYGFYPVDKVLVVPFFLGVASMYCVVLLNQYLLNMDGLIEAVTNSVVFMVAYSILVYKFTLTHEDRELLSKVKAKLLRRAA